MVAPARRIPHYTAPRYETVMVPKTVMVEPAGVRYVEIPAEYRTVHRTVATYSRCGGCSR